MSGGKTNTLEKMRLSWTHGSHDGSEATDDALDEFEPERARQGRPPEETRFAVGTALDRSCDQEAQVFEQEVRVARGRSQFDRSHSLVVVVLSRCSTVSLERGHVDVERRFGNVLRVDVGDERVFADDAVVHKHEQLPQRGRRG